MKFFAPAWDSITFTEGFRREVGGGLASSTHLISTLLKFLRNTSNNKTWNLNFKKTKKVIFFIFVKMKSFFQDKVDNRKGFSCIAWKENQPQFLCFCSRFSFWNIDALRRLDQEEEDEETGIKDEPPTRKQPPFAKLHEAGKATGTAPKLHEVDHHLWCKKNTIQG